MNNTLKHDNFIDGQWVATQKYKPNINPSDTTEIIGHYAVGDQSQVTAAIRAARAVQPKWAEASSLTRFKVLNQAANIIEERTAELGKLLAREGGKPLGEATAEVTRGRSVIPFFRGRDIAKYRRNSRFRSTWYER